MEQDQIIVFQQFDNLIEANIIRTKLDAHGIPCFLTEEYVTHLTGSQLSGGIRLHIFDKDKIQVKEIILETILSKADEESSAHCPQCHSRRIFINKKNDDSFQMNQVVFSFIMQLTQQHYCLDCGHEFN